MFQSIHKKVEKAAPVALLSNTSTVAKPLPVDFDTEAYENFLVRLCVHHRIPFHSVRFGLLRLWINKFSPHLSAHKPSPEHLRTVVVDRVVNQIKDQTRREIKKRTTRQEEWSLDVQVPLAIAIDGWVDGTGKGLVGYVLKYKQTSVSGSIPLDFKDGTFIGAVDQLESCMEKAQDDYNMPVDCLITDNESAIRKARTFLQLTRPRLYASHCMAQQKNLITKSLMHDRD